MGGPPPETRRPPPAIDPATSRNGIVLAVQGLSGGVGATTFAVNLAWELAVAKDDERRVCLIDAGLSPLRTRRLLAGLGIDARRVAAPGTPQLALRWLPDAAGKP